MAKEEIKKIIESEKVKFLQLWFTDILGAVKSFTIPAHEVGRALDGETTLDGSSIIGFTPIENSDMMIQVDPESFRLLPWKDGEHKTAMMFGEILNSDGSVYADSNRAIFKKVLDEAKSMGFEFFAGPEAEYFYFNSTDKSIIDTAGYFESLPTDLGEVTREKTVNALEKLGIAIECAHHEVAPSQHEIDMRYDQGLKMAEKVLVYKMAVKEIARQDGLIASFMPKPIAGENGSGMHTHQSLFKGGENIFFDASDAGHLSATAKYYIAGLLKHAPAITAICNQYVNSYKRLVPGYEAPVYVAWARKNRSAMIRVPAYKEGKDKSMRIELRSPDPLCNPYLAFAVMLAAGLDGIKNKYELPAPVEENIYKMDDAKRDSLGIKSLPGSLKDALSELEKDEVIKSVLGPSVYAKFVKIKIKEWDEYRMQVDKMEVEKYLNV